MGITNLEQFVDRFQTLLREKPDISRLIRTGRSFLSELLSNKDWFGDVCRKILFDPEFHLSHAPGIWPNEITLYRSADKSLLILCYIWGAYMSDTIHDHGSWGIIGSFLKPIREFKYKRLDDGNKEGYAELKEISSAVLQPGETSFVLPLNNGIHKMENFSSDVTVTINVYGRSIRKGYIQFFNPVKKSVSRVYPPKSFREALVLRALGTLHTPWSEEILKGALNGPLSEPIKEECEFALARLKGNQF